MSGPLTRPPSPRTPPQSWATSGQHSYRTSGEGPKGHLSLRLFSKRSLYRDPTGADYSQYTIGVLPCNFLSILNIHRRKQMYCRRDVRRNWGGRKSIMSGKTSKRENGAQRPSIIKHRRLAPVCFYFVVTFRTHDNLQTYPKNPQKRNANRTHRKITEKLQIGNKTHNTDNITYNNEPIRTSTIQQTQEDPHYSTTRLFPPRYKQGPQLPEPKTLHDYQMELQKQSKSPLRCKIPPAEQIATTLVES